MIRSGRGEATESRPPSIGGACALPRIQARVRGCFNKPTSESHSLGELVHAGLKVGDIGGHYGKARRELGVDLRGALQLVRKSHRSTYPGTSPKHETRKHSHSTHLADV